MNDVARVRGAALLGVLEALLEVRREFLPPAVIPDPPGVEALLLEEVALARVGEGRRRLASIGPAADESQCADLRCADQGVAELAADAKQAAEQMYKQLAITADDIAEVIAFAVTRPRRMTLNEIPVWPTAQA